MRMASIGHAVVGFREASWVDNKTNYNWEQLSADLKTNEAVLAQIRAGLEKPAFDNRLDYSRGFKMQFTNLAEVKQMAYWFGDASQLALHEGNPHEATENLTAQIRLPLLLANDRTIISELVRDATAAMAKFTTWEALQADGWTDADLESMQQAWQEPDFASSMTRGLEGERILIDTSFGLLRKSNEDTVNAFYWPDSGDFDDSPTFANTLRDVWKKQIYCRIWRFAWSHQDERRYLETVQSLLETTRSKANERSYTGMLAGLERIHAEISNHNFYDEWRFNASSLTAGALSRAIEKGMRAETERSTALCAIALKRYSLRHGNYPASLDALVPEFLPSVPVDYMDGKPMKYHLNPDGSFTLYSVGEDGKDDGGDASLQPGWTSFHDLWRGKDMVWPQPATAAELEAWRIAEAKN
jgi:hypothetical protein